MRFSLFVLPAASAALAFSPLFNLSVHAQTGDASDAVVVTATRTPTRVSELTSDVTVLEREQIQRSGSLVQALRSVPGLEFTQSGGLGTTASVYIRGTNPDHTLILVDGVRFGSATTGVTPLENLPLDQIERIEVVRGPGSSIYGSSALGGVIQIFTRSGAGNPGMNASATYGSYGTTALSFGHGYEKDEVRAAFQVGALETDGITAIRNPRSASFNPDADSYRNANLSANLSRRFGTSGEAGLRTFYSDGMKRFDTAPAAFDHRIYYTLDSNTAYVNTRLAERWQSRFSVGNSTDNATTTSAVSSRNVIRTVQDQYTWQNDLTLPVGSLMLGAEKVDQKVSGNTVFPVSRRTIDTVMAAWQASLGRHYFQVSSRHDRFDRLGKRNTGYAGYGYDITPALRFTASTGTAFKAPTFNQIYFPGFGNPNVRPESASNSEVGLAWSQGGVRLGVVHFENRIRDLIVNTGTPLTPVNIGEARISGNTITASGDIHGTQVGATLNLQDPKDGASGRLLPRRAQRSGSLTASRPAFSGMLGVEVLASSMRYDDSANLLRLGGYSIVNAWYEAPLGRGWTGFVRGENLGNKLYQLVQDFNVPGRSVFIGARYTPGR